MAGKKPGVNDGNQSGGQTSKRAKKREMKKVILMRVLMRSWPTKRFGKARLAVETTHRGNAFNARFTGIDCTISRASKGKKKQAYRLRILKIRISGEERGRVER